MQKVYLALYKGPPTNDIVHVISHWVTCIVLSIRDLKITKYSHSEIYIDGICYSSSVRDGGVRSKVIDLNSGKWDIVDLSSFIDTAYALEVFKTKEGNRYDWFGALGFGLPFLKQDPNKEFCFEICATMLNLPGPAKWTPARFIKHFTRYANSE